MNSFRIHLLKLIQSKDGQLSWYQIDRAFTSEGIDRRENLMQSLKGLELGGYIDTHFGLNRSQPTYSITSAGIAALSNNSSV